LAALNGYSILDTLPEKEYDDIAFLASQICGTPIALISLIDEKRQWFKSHHGFNATETPREVAFCAHAINDKGNILIVPDSREDIRFHDNPLVTGDPRVVFYAGVPLVNSAGHALGTLCVVDNKPNHLNEGQVQALKALTSQLNKLLELRMKSLDLELKVRALEIQNLGLEKFACVAAHDIKSPLCDIISIVDLLEQDYLQNMDPEGIKWFKLITTSSEKLNALIEGILQYSRNIHALSSSTEKVNIHQLARDIMTLLTSSSEIGFSISPGQHVEIFTNKTALEQILINLISNGIKYNDKSEPAIHIDVEEQDEWLKITVTDNGPGIDDEHHDRIFHIFETASPADRTGKKGTGIGLATVKSLVEGLGGTISVRSEIGTGSSFEFTIRK